MSQYDFFTILALTGFTLSSIGLVILLVYNKWRTERLVRSPNINRNRNSFYFLFWCFNTIPGVNTVFQKVLENTEILYPADRMSINQEATKSMAKSSGIVIIMVVYTLLVSRGDIINERSSLASLLSLAPAMFLIFGYMVAPMSTLVSKMFSQMQLTVE